MKELTEAPVCSVSHVDQRHEQEIRERLPGDEAAVDAAAVFSYLSDSTRLRLLSMLAVSDLCVCEMADLLNMSQPAVSHHLRVLRQCDAVQFRRLGQRTIYALSDNEIGNMIRRLLEVAGCGGEQHA